jgi:Rubisco Assembly chaperone C-terminal domain/Rubisco accumulation factor 1 alpha helical domain/Rubisco accumulation factor 1 helix turn helix domain
MTATPPDHSNRQPAADPPETSGTPELLQSLRRKEGNWVGWGQACQQLQKLGYTQQQIFEETGFEPVQQNQVIVASQVYGSLVSGGAAAAVLERFERTGSDSLYALRILMQPERVAAATLLVEKGLDSEAAHEVAKALKEFSRVTKKPEEFPDYPGDAIAYSYWKLARQQADLQARSRLIAQGLLFAQSASARQQIEKLLTDFTITRSRSAPRLPFYRLESEDEQPRVVPVAGKMPLAAADLKAVPLVDTAGIFHIVQFSGEGAWVALPGWQVVMTSEDPVMVLIDSDQLPTSPSGIVLETVEEMLVMVDRSQRQWDNENYFVFDEAGELRIDWFEEVPDLVILGKVVLVLRPKKVLDEDFNKQLWQLDE